MRRGTLIYVLLAVGLASAASSTAYAQLPGRADAAPEQAPPTAQPPAPAITPPVVKKNEGASYPKQALDEGFHQVVQVSLVLEVDPTGAVKHAVVETPAGHGFDEAAVAAASKLEFEPATRGGKPIAVKIPFTYTFTPPPSVLSGRVVTLAGEHPVAGATVVVTDGAQAAQTLTTDATGAWRVEGLSAGTYHVTIRAVGRAPHEVDETVQPGEEATSVDRLALEEAPPSATAPNVPEPDVEVVEVHGEKPPRSLTKRTLDQREISRIPGTNGDALRSLQNLPGVARPPGLAGLLIVRGSAPQDSQYFIDGTPVPIVYHFGGLSSVVPTEMIEPPRLLSRQLQRAVRARHGRHRRRRAARAGGRSSSTAWRRSTSSTRACSRRGRSSTPGWRFAVAGRRSYLDLWLGPVLKAAQSSVSVSPVYYDYQAILERDLGKHSTIRFAFFGSDDKLDAPQHRDVVRASRSSRAASSTHTGFWRGQALYKNRVQRRHRVPRSWARSAATSCRSARATSSSTSSTTRSPGARRALAEARQAPHDERGPRHDRRAVHGARRTCRRSPSRASRPPGPFSAQVPLSTQVTGDASTSRRLYVEWEATPWRGARIVPGIRARLHEGHRVVGPRSRASSSVRTSRPSPRTTIKGGVGLFSQPPQAQETNAVFGTPGLTDQRAIHYDLGVEREVTRNIDASLEGFYKQLDYLVEPGRRQRRAPASSYGAETLIRYKPDARFFGWLAYTLSRSAAQGRAGRCRACSSQFDETHILTVLGSYRLGPRLGDRRALPA